MSCPADRPILSNGRCIDHCPKDQYFEPSGSSCRTCDKSCGACVGPSAAECTTCPEGYMLKAGKCVPATCKHGVVPHLNICLEDLVGGKADLRYLGFLALLVVVAVSGLSFWLFVRRQRRQTREATKDFADALDDKDVRDRMLILRLEKVLGLDRIRPTASPPRLAEQGETKAKEKKKLRELLLISRRKRETKGKEIETIPLTERSRISLFGRTCANASEGKKIVGETSHVPENQWSAPPPPYVYEGSGSQASIASGSQFEYPPMKTKIVSMSAPDSPELIPRTLRPPPRRNDSDSSYGSSVKVPVGQAALDGKELDRRAQLKDLWPAMPSPVFGDIEAFEAEPRKGEGWV